MLKSVLASGLSILLTVPASAQLGFGQKPAASAPLGAVLVELAGKVEYQPNGGSDWIAAKLQQKLDQGDMVLTDINGSVVILFMDGSKVRLSKNAAFVMEQQSQNKVEFKVNKGFFEAWVKKLSGRRWRIRTPSAVASIRGTSLTGEVLPTGVTAWNLFTGDMMIGDNFGNNRDMNPGDRLLANQVQGVLTIQQIPAGVVMADKPDSKDIAEKIAQATGKKAADAEDKAKKAADAAKKAEEKAKEEGTPEAKKEAAKAKQEAMKAQVEARKASAENEFAQQIVNLENLSNESGPLPPPGPGGPRPPAKPPLDGDKPPLDGDKPPVDADGNPIIILDPNSPPPLNNPNQDEAIEDLLGFPDDTSPSGPPPPPLPGAI